MSDHVWAGLLGRIPWSRFVHFRCPPSGTNFISHNSINFYMLSSNLLVVTRTNLQFLAFLLQTLRNFTASKVCFHHFVSENFMYYRYYVLAPVHKLSIYARFFWRAGFSECKHWWQKNSNTTKRNPPFVVSLSIVVKLHSFRIIPKALYLVFLVFYWIMSGVTPTPSCLIHFKGEKGPLTCFTETSIKQVLTSHKLWIKLDGKQREITDKTVHTLKSHENIQCPSNLYYHRTCYSNSRMSPF